MVMSFGQRSGRTSRPNMIVAALVFSATVSRSQGFMASPAPVRVRGQPWGSSVSIPAIYGRNMGVSHSFPSEKSQLGYIKAPGVSQATRRRLQLSMVATPLPETYQDVAQSIALEHSQGLVFAESTTRSVVKALTWRLTAGVITLVSGLMFSGSWSTAMSIVGSDFLTKSCTMFLGERLWNKIKWGQGKTGDSAKRSLTKALMWRAFAACNTLICGVLLAGDLSAALKIAGTDTVFKTGIFFFNERIWNSIRWGKVFEPEHFM